MAKTIIFNADGSVYSNADTAGGNLVYNRMDVGILLLNQAMQANDTYDFRVPGDSNNNTFRYRFPRDGWVLGATFTGTVSATISGGVYAQKTSATTGTNSDIMTPSDAGNTQVLDTTNFPKTGVKIMAPAPIPCAAGDLVAMKFHTQSAVTVSLAGFLLVGLTPQ